MTGVSPTWLFRPRTTPSIWFAGPLTCDLIEQAVRDLWSFPYPPKVGLLVNSTQFDDFWNDLRCNRRAPVNPYWGPGVAWSPEYLTVYTTYGSVELYKSHYSAPGVLYPCMLRDFEVTVERGVPYQDAKDREIENQKALVFEWQLRCRDLENAIWACDKERNCGPFLKEDLLKVYRLLCDRVREAAKVARR